MNRLNVIAKITNIILGIFYVPFSFFCYLLPMGYENKEITNKVFEFMFNVLAFGMFIFCIGSIVCSAKLIEKGKVKLALGVQFIPFGILVLMGILYVASVK